MNKRLAALIAVCLIAIVTTVYFISKPTFLFDENEVFPDEFSEVAFEDAVPLFKFGIPLELFDTEEGKIKRNQTFADILLPFNVTRQDIFTMDKISKQVFSVRNFIPKKRYTIFYNTDSLDKKEAAYFVYEPNDLEYVIYQIQDSLAVFREARNVEIVERTMAGVISETLDHSIRAEGGSAALVSAMADVFGWQIDPKNVEKGRLV